MKTYLCIEVWRLHKISARKRFYKTTRFS